MNMNNEDLARQYVEQLRKEAENNHLKHKLRLARSVQLKKGLRKGTIQSWIRLLARMGRRVL